MRSEQKVAAAVLAVCVLVVAGVLCVFGPQEKRSEYGRIGIIGAMDEEVELLISEMKGMESEEIGGDMYYLGTIRGKEVVVVKSGMGKVNASSAATNLISVFGVSAIMNTGVSGALLDGMAPFTIVVPDGLIQHDFDYTAMGYERGEIPGSGLEFRPDGYLKEMAIRAVEDNIPQEGSFKEGLCLTGDQFIGSKEQRQALLGLFPDGITCEMEGGQIAQVCTAYDVPFAELRVISDSETEDFEKFMHEAAVLCASIVIEFVDLVWEE